MTRRTEGHLHNEQAQARLRERRKAREKQRREDLGAWLSTQVGRRLFWDLIDRRCNLGGEDLVVSGEDGRRLSDVNAGRRRVGQELKLEAVRDFPDLFTLAFQEAVAAAREDEVHRKSATDQTETDK